MKQMGEVSLSELKRVLVENKIYPKGIEKDNIYEWFEWIIGNMARAVTREDIEEALRKALDFWGIANKKGGVR